MERDAGNAHTFSDDVNSTPSSGADFLIVQRPGYHKDALGSASCRLDYLTASMAPVSRMQTH